MKRKTADVIVAGGGPAGAVAARELALAGLRVLMFDDVDPRERKIGESLLGAARPLCRHLGLESVLERSEHLLAFGNASAWGGDELHTVDFIRDPNGLGLHLDRAVFDQSLREAAVAAGVQWIPERVRDVKRKEGGVVVAGGSVSASARWVVDASGRRARVATRMGATLTRDDSLVALATWVQPAAADPDMRSLIISAPSGWWYSAKVPGGARVLACFSDRYGVRRLAKDENEFRAAAAAISHLAPYAIGSTFLTPVRGYVACGATLDRPFGEHWIATGDAAVAFDPVSSQGIFHALYSGMKAGRAVVAALAGKTDPLLEYSRELSRIRAAYLIHHRQAYAAEARFAAQAFWRRRGGLDDSAALNLPLAVG